MSGLVDHEAAWRGLRRELRRQRDEEGRTSFGVPQLLELLDRLEDDSAIVESADHAVLRRFSGHLTDTFLALVPAGTDRPLIGVDRDDVADDGERPGPPDDQLGGHDGQHRREPVGAGPADR